MTLKERLQAEYQNEIEKMAQAEELLNFQVRCLYKAAEYEGVAHELADLADEDVIKLAQEMDYEGTFDEFREDPSLLFTEEEIKMAQDAEHADLMGRYMARSFAEETRKLAYEEEVSYDPDVQDAYEYFFGKYAAKDKAAKRGFKFLNELSAQGVKHHAKQKLDKMRNKIMRNIYRGSGGQTVNMKALPGKTGPKIDGTGRVVEPGKSVGRENADAAIPFLKTRRGKHVAFGAGTLGLAGAGAGAGYMASKGKGRKKTAAAEFEIEAVKVASDLMEFAQYELPQGADLTLEKAASMVTADEYPVLERAWEILGEQGILA